MFAFCTSGGIISSSRCVSRHEKELRRSEWVLVLLGQRQDVHVPLKVRLQVDCKLHHSNGMRQPVSRPRASVWSDAQAARKIVAAVSLTNNYVRS